MTKKRVHELAKELNMKSKDLVEWLKAHGIAVKTHMSTLSDKELSQAENMLNPDKNVQPSKKTSGIKKTDNRSQDNKQYDATPTKQPPSGLGAIPKQTASAHKATQRKRIPDKRSARKPVPHTNAPQRPADNNKLPGNSIRGKNEVNQKRKPLPTTTDKPKHANKNVENNSNFNRNKDKPADERRGGKDYSRQIRKTRHQKRRDEAEIKMPRDIIIPDSLQVRELAELLRVSAGEIVKKLMELGVMANINQTIDYETAEIVAAMYSVSVEHEISPEEEILSEIVDTPESLKSRPPVVTVMGHVDHGKTSLLDKIRKADVASGEAGGITQHIGAYQVKINNNNITFVDTPGHEAFTAMRARGANLTDIVVLVIAADDGVKPQTIEAINHIKAAKLPFLIALNKIDKPDINPDRVKQQLAEYGIVTEDWGGDTVLVPVSAKTGLGIDNLLEMILIISELHDLKANPNRAAEGVVIESKLDKGKGPVATILVQKGTLRVGDFILSGTDLCKVRTMIDYKGKRLDKALPSTPVEITGWSEVPTAGEKVLVCDEKIAKEVSSLRADAKKLEEQKKSSKVSLDEFFQRMQDTGIKELNLIIKGDVQGSVEALSQSLLKLSTDEVKLSIIHSAVGAVKETDVMLASASDAVIIGFNVRPDVKARQYAEQEGIDIHLYKVIYEAIEDVKKAMAGLLEPEFKEKYLGRAEIRQVIKIPNIGSVAGSYVIEGKIQRNANTRILREGVIVYEGQLSSLRRFKDDVKEVVAGYECGIGIQDFNDFKVGDLIEAYIVEEIPREL